jgi:site-specific DNA-methyltransferase (adenine-specific)
VNGQAQFTLRGRNPDVLTCIANLSNDEVFTPPEFANRMLDTLAEAWAAGHGGANLWADKTVRFLDPCAKSGVFLREITRRLTQGLADEMPDLQQRVDHILTKQVFGIGITQLTAMLARRSVYCSKHADGEHSIAKGFNDDAGNIWFERMEHAWGDTKCEFCGAPKAILDREEGLENYAYALIHTNNIKARVAELFGDDMQFDVIIGNPPYQMKGGAGGTSDSSIYHLFVEQAKKLEPKYLAMVVPSRWLAGGRGMDEFRKEMLGSHKLLRLVDFPVSKEVFPNVEVKGGICYFLWAESHNGPCDVTVVRGKEESSVFRQLDEFDVFVRDTCAVGILHKVIGAPHFGMDSLVSNREPFKLESNFDGFHDKKKTGDIVLHYVRGGKRDIGFVPRSAITKNTALIDKWKVLVPKAGSDGGQKIPDSVLGKPWLSAPPSACTGSFLAIPADSEAAARSIQSYYTTKFFRFLVSLRKITQDAFSHMYSWVPVQQWDRQWTDKVLYKKYGLTVEEIDYIEAVIRPMDNAETDGDA